MPSIPQKDWSYYKTEYDAGRMSQGAIAKELHITQGAVSRRLKKMASAAVDGSPESEPRAPDEETQAIETVHPMVHPSEPTTALQRVEYVGEPSGEPGVPDIARQSDLDTLKTRVEVLEAFIASLQQQQIPLPGSPNGSPVVHQVHSGSPSGSPTHKRGFVLADDLWDAIHTYAEAHHWQIAQVVDVALRTFFAGQAVHDG